MITQMKVRGLMFDPYNNAYIVILRDEDRSDMLPIWVEKLRPVPSVLPWKIFRRLGP